MRPETIFDVFKPFTARHLLDAMTRQRFHIEYNTARSGGTHGEGAGMFHFSPSAWLVALGIFLTAGGTIACIAGRCAADSGCLWCQRLYTACLVTLGACTLMAVRQQDGTWVLHAIAYAGLILVATCETQPRMDHPPHKFINH